MSIAQARASMIRSHYIFVALLLGVMAAIAFGTLATQARGGDTTVLSTTDGTPARQAPLRGPLQPRSCPMAVST